MLTYMIAKNEIGIGDVVRVIRSDLVPEPWIGVMAVVVEMATAETDEDTLLLEAACGYKLSVALEETAQLDIVDQLAWLGWKETVAEFRAEIEKFKQARDRENEWIQAGEIVRVADEQYVYPATALFNRDAPVTDKELAGRSHARWLKTVRWCDARVLVPPKREGDEFVVFVLNDEEADEEASWACTRREIGWYEVFRIEETPE